MHMVLLSHALQPPDVDMRVGEVVGRLLRELHHSFELPEIFGPRPVADHPFVTVARWDLGTIITITNATITTTITNTIIAITNTISNITNTIITNTIITITVVYNNNVVYWAIITIKW